MASVCSSCGSFDIVSDYSSGDRTCRNCGLVAEERMIMDDLEHNWSWCKDTHAVCTGDMAIALHHKDIHQSMETMLVCLHMDNSAIAGVACATYDLIKETYQFRGEMLNAVFAACIYLACLKSTERTPRAAHEIYDMFHIDSKQFHRALKKIQGIVPKTMPEKRFKEDDGVVRQLEQLTTVPPARLYEVVRRVSHYNAKRKDMKYMLATPPTTINAVLIALACEDLKIPLNKNEMIQKKWASVVTLNKHVKKIRSLLPRS